MNVNELNEQYIYLSFLKNIIIALFNNECNYTLPCVYSFQHRYKKIIVLQITVIFNSR